MGPRDKALLFVPLIVVWEGQNTTSWRGSVFSLGNNILEREWLLGMGNWSIDLLT